jgi:hypothetical protein
LTALIREKKVQVAERETVALLAWSNKQISSDAYIHGIDSY